MRFRSLSRPAGSAALGAVIVACGVAVALSLRGNAAEPWMVIGCNVAAVAFALSALRGVAVADRAAVRRRSYERLGQELDRARRFGHPVTLVGATSSAPTPRLLDRLGSGVRSQDLVMRSPWGDSVIVVAPELDAATRPIFLDRIAAALAPEPTPEIRAATFPDDAVTLDALLAILECGRPRLGRLGPRPSRLRRLLESTVAFVALVAVAPLIVIAGGAIKLDSPGGAFYRQERTGRDGRRFRIWKLRTMVAEAELLKETVGHLNVNDVANFKIPDDPRVTRVGRRLRRFSIDELPQLWNVVRGEMRLVGPRPTALPASAHEPWQTARLDVDPGITGLWQVTGRGTSTFVERCRLDIRYVRRRSCWLDLRLLVRTIPSALGRRGVT